MTQPVDDDHPRQAGDAEVLLDMVAGLGGVRLIDPQPQAEGDLLDIEQDPHADMRGPRDRDPGAENPWRAA